MSEQQHDERGIDEILASIDEMLNEKQLYEYKPTQKEQITALKTGKPQPKVPEQKSAEKTPPADNDKQQPVKKVVLSAADEIKPQNAAVDKAAVNGIPKSPFDLSDEDFGDEELPDIESGNASTNESADNSSEKVMEKAAEQAASAPEESEKTADPEIQDIDSDESDEFDEPDEIEDEPTDDEDDSEEESDESAAITSKHRIVLTEAFLEPSAQEALPLWIEQDNPKRATPAKPQPKQQSQAPKMGNPATLKTEMDNAEAAVQHESIERNELVEAIVHDALSTKPEELSTAVKHEMAAIISKYELNQLAEIITEEVSAELQKQIQENLPKLIQKSLRQHFELLDKDTE